jgi:serine/threonine protein kinase
VRDEDDRPTLSMRAGGAVDDADEDTSTSTAPEQVAPGTDIGGYTVDGELGRGGMGVVYEAEDVALGRHVALKFLPDGISDPSALERFRREARAASSLNHAHICTIHAIDQHAGRPFMVMELMEGSTVRELLASGNPLPLAQAAGIAAQVADALHAAHARGIVHRDLKPANVFVTNEGQAKLVDFGLAQWRESLPMPAGTRVAPSAVGEHLTATGGAVGTVPYMSPEQALGEGVDARSDLFSLGVLLYEMATGSRPFEDATDARTLEAIVGRAPVPIETRNPELPAALSAIVAKLLEKDRQQRYQDAAEVHRDLRHLLCRSPGRFPVPLRDAGRGGSWPGPLSSRSRSPRAGPSGIRAPGPISPRARSPCCRSSPRARRGTSISPTAWPTRSAASSPPCPACASSRAAAPSPTRARPRRLSGLPASWARATSSPRRCAGRRGRTAFT